jgi:hypothetical protein
MKTMNNNNNNRLAENRICVVILTSWYKSPKYQFVEGPMKSTSYQYVSWEHLRCRFSYNLHLMQIMLLLIKNWSPWKHSCCGKFSLVHSCRNSCRVFTWSYYLRKKKKSYILQDSWADTAAWLCFQNAWIQWYTWDHVRLRVSDLKHPRGDAVNFSSAVAQLG